MVNEAILLRKYGHSRKSFQLQTKPVDFAWLLSFSHTVVVSKLTMVDIKVVIVEGLTLFVVELACPSLEVVIVIG